MSAPVWQRGETLAQVSEALAAVAAACLGDALAARGRALLAVPGGTTPRLFLMALARKPLDWAHIAILPTDERLVASGHPRSNRTMIAEALQPAVAQGADLIDLVGPALAPAAALSHARRTLAALPSLDLLVSGMGTDGHVASLFPGDPQVLDAGPGDAILARPAGLEPRLSLAARRLTQARHAALLISGVDKQAVLVKIDSTTDPLTFPVALLVSRPAPPLSVFWSPV